MANYEQVVIGSYISGTIYNGTLGGQSLIVKKIRKQLNCSEKQLNRLLNLNSENVVKYFASYSECSEYACNLVIERCHTSLVEFVKSKDLKHKTALIVAQIATGLHYLHSRNIIHGALKPQNVMIWRNESSKRFFVKITDYGLMDTAKLEEKDPFLDAAKAEDIRALGEIACFVGSRGTRTSAENITGDDLPEIGQNLSVALEFIRATTHSDPNFRPDSDVIIYHPFLFIGCEEVCHEFVKFVCRNAYSDLETQFSDQMKNWLEKIPEEVERLSDDEDIDDLKEFIGKIVEANLTDSMKLMELVTSASHAVPLLFSHFIWEFLVRRHEKPKVQLLHVIGEGRFGRVHKAIWRYNGQVAEIAVKRTRFSYVREKGRKLDRELERLKGLKSPFVVRFIGHRNTNLRNETLIFLELCDGTLTKFVLGELPNIPRSAIQDKDIIGQLILGLSYLHGKKIVHKDLTPNNILLSKREDLVLVKLADFGLSNQLKDEESNFSNTVNPGTVAYAAPEILEINEDNPQKPTFASDIWSLGVVVFYVLSQGEHPYGLNDQRSHFINKLKFPPNIHILNDWLAIHLVMQMMHWHPQKRPNIFHLLSHPYFTAYSRPMKYLVNTNFWDCFLSNEGEVKIFLKASKVKEWFEALKEEVAGAEASFREFHGKSNGVGKVDERARSLQKIIENISTVINLASRIQEIVIERGLFQRYERILDKAGQLFPLFVWCKVVEMTKEVEEAKRFQITDFQYSMLVNGNSTLTKFLLNRDDSVQDENVNGITPLHLAATLSNVDVFILFLARGANIRPTDLNGLTPLHNSAEFSSDVEVFKLLLVGSSDIEATDSSGATPMHWAAAFNPDVKVIELLLVGGADIKATDSSGLTPLHWAAEKSSYDKVIELLLNRGADISATCLSGATPLHWAAAFNPNVEVIKLLLDRGADIKARNSYEETPLHWAAASNPNVKVIELLLEREADINATDSIRRTPLHWAAASNPNVEVIKLLLDRGADINATTSIGATPLQNAAASNPNFEVMQLLIDRVANPTLPCC